jgi:hypothetical protein
MHSQMQKKLILLLIVVCCRINLYSQDSTNATRTLGLIVTVDGIFNFPDKVLNAGTGRRFTVGASFTNHDRAYIAFIGVGVKWKKNNVFSPTFRKSFIKDVQANYVPIKGAGEDSLIGAKMYSSPKGDLWGTYGGFFQAGFLWNKNKFKPTAILCVGLEDFLLHDKNFINPKYPEDKEQDHLGLWTTFYEFKIGGAIPIKTIIDQRFYPFINIGYKWVDYDGLFINSTPLSAYTTGSLANKYNASGKITLSVSFLLWSNWDPEYDYKGETGN